MTTFTHYSTKTYTQAFPVAYRQWRADSHCNQIHGYALSVHIEFGSNDLDARNWVVDFGGLKPLKGLLEDWFDHTWLIAEDDPQRAIMEECAKATGSRVTVVKATGCEALSEFIFEYINTCWLRDYGYHGRVWCTKVEVRETQANMAMRVLRPQDME